MFILLEEAGLKPNLGSYCAALECMGRSPKCSPRVISRYVHGYTLHHGASIIYILHIYTRRDNSDPVYGDWICEKKGRAAIHRFTSRCHAWLSPLQHLYILFYFSLL